MIRASTVLAVSVLLAAAAQAAPVFEQGEPAPLVVNNSRATAQAIAPAAFTPNTNPNVFGALPTATIFGTAGDSGGTGDVDFFSFSTAGGAAYFDIDNTPENPGLAFPTILSLFDAGGTLLAFGLGLDVEEPGDPGSLFGNDAFLGTVTLPAGTYFIAVSGFLTGLSGFGNFPTQAFAPGTERTRLRRPDQLALPDDEIFFNNLAVANAAPGDSGFGTNMGNADTLPYRLEISIQSVPEPGTLALLGAGLLGLARAGRRRVA